MDGYSALLGEWEGDLLSTLHIASIPPNLRKRGDLSYTNKLVL